MKTAPGLPYNAHGQELANVSIIMCTIAGFLVICRLCVRFTIHRLTGWDDYTLVAALVRTAFPLLLETRLIEQLIAIAMTVCFNMGTYIQNDARIELIFIPEVYYGMGLHTKQVDAHNKVLAFTVRFYFERRLLGNALADGCLSGFGSPSFCTNSQMD